MRRAATAMLLGGLMAAGLGCSRKAAPTATTTSPSTPATASAAGVDPPGTYMGRTLATPMGWQGADWLERDDRDATERPEHVLDVLGVGPGAVVGDVGCGSGYFTTRLAKRVGPSGRVLATDLQPQMLDLLRKKLDAQKIGNVVPLLATETDAKLPRGELDLVLMVDVYHELPRPAETLAQIRAALKPTGRVALVEYRAEDPDVPIKPEHKMTLAQIKKELGANELVFRSSDESLPRQRIVIFGRAP
ncbi:MAG: class I SAM-dependent methyltransferase [Deltaproteobacteria bacterium]|nr:class I SAM-dependent methyltransferase [Deltaproteobacteria bacterium]